jgi:VanZ family protein
VVALWALVILRLSADDLSAASTSRLLGALLRWLAGDVGPATLAFLNVLARKSAHFLEYAVLGALAAAAARRTPRLGLARGVVLSLILCFGLACVDESRQSRSRARTGAWQDVGIDALGGAAGIGLTGLVGRRRRPRIVARASPGDAAAGV